jgi:predicted dehydrogenase
MDLAQAREMYRKAEAAGIVHMTNFTNRGLPAAMRMKQLLGEAYVGQPYHVFVTVLASLHREPVMPWRRDKPQTGTGVLGDIGSHMIDLSRWFMGDVRRVAGHLSTVQKELRLPGSDRMVPNETDDTCGMLLEFESGVQGMIHVSWVAQPAAGGIMRAEVHGSDGVLIMDRRRGTGDTRSWVTVQGTKSEAAKLDWLPPDPEITGGLDLSSEDGLTATLNRKPYWAARRFVEAVLGNREPVASLYDGAECQAVIDSVAESAQKGLWVDVPEV